MAAISSAVEDADTTGGGVDIIFLAVGPVAVGVIEEGAADSKELVVVVREDIEGKAWLQQVRRKAMVEMETMNIANTWDLFSICFSFIPFNMVTCDILTLVIHQLQ